MISIQEYYFMIFHIILRHLNSSRQHFKKYPKHHCCQTPQTQQLVIQYLYIYIYTIITQKDSFVKLSSIIFINF